jgi:hypothetical protein
VTGTVTGNPAGKDGFAGQLSGGQANCRLLPSENGMRVQPNS